MPSCKRTKKTFQQLEEADMDDEDYLESMPAWKTASKAAKSRMAAKYRRDKEAEYLDKLAELIPLPSEVTSKLDKASILRLTISFLKLREQMSEDNCNGVCSSSEKCNSEAPGNGTKGINGGLHLNEAELLMQSLGGFLIFISRRGKILFVSENVVQHVGFTQADMIGNKVTMFMHQDDKREMCKQFSPNPSSESCFKNALPCSGNEENCLLKEEDDPDSINPKTFICERSAFYLRMRYQVVKEGSKTKHTGYLLTQWTGRIQLTCRPDCNGKCRRAITGMVAIIRPMQSSAITEIRLDGNMFMSRHNMDMKFIFCDPRILTLVGYEPTELLGRTAYDFHNPFDAPKIRKCHTNLIHKGQSVSKYYRFLGKNGEWVWMQTRATIIYNTSNEPQYVVCMNYVISQDEGRRHLMMEQEDLKDQELPKGAIDVTSLSSPGPAHSSGYCSADEDHSYSNSKTRETYSPGIQSPAGSSSQPHTPPSISSPGLLSSTGHSNSMVTASLLEEKMQEISDEDMIDMIGEMLPPAVTSAGLADLPPGCQGSFTDSWITGLSNDIEMMDVDQNGVLTSPLGDVTDSEGLLLNLLRNSEKGLDDLPAQTQQAADKLSPVTPDLGQALSELDMLGVVPSTSAVITQSNVMLSSTTQQANDPVQAGTTCSKAVISQMPNVSLNPLETSSSLPLTLSSSLDSGVLASAKANMTISSFNPGMMGLSSELDGTMSDNTKDFSFKYAENMADQQLNATIASYFDGDNVMESNPSMSMQDMPLNGLGDSPFNLLSDNTNTLSSFLTSSSTSVSTPSLQPSCSTFKTQLSAPVTKHNVFAQPKPPRTVTTSCSSPSNSHAQLSKSLPSSSKLALSGQQHPHNHHHHHRAPTVKSKSTAAPRQQQKATSHHISSFPALDDHRYTNKQLESSPQSSSHKGSGSSSHRNSHKSGSHRHSNGSSYHHNNSNNSHSNGSHHHHHHSNHSSQSQSSNHTPLLLEKFLLTKEKLNPNKGSEAALATQGLSALHLGERGDQHDSALGDTNQQLLKKLLTEEIKPRDMQKAQQEVIMDRRLSAGSSPTTCPSPTLMNTFSLDLDDLSQSIQLLSEDTSNEMDKVWAPPGGDGIPSELDEILQEERRQNDLWLQHCINELL